MIPSVLLLRKRRGAGARLSFRDHGGSDLRLRPRPGTSARNGGRNLADMPFVAWPGTGTAGDSDGADHMSVRRRAGREERSQDAGGRDVGGRRAGADRGPGAGGAGGRELGRGDAGGRAARTAVEVADAERGGRPPDGGGQG